MFTLHLVRQLLLCQHWGELCQWAIGVVGHFSKYFPEKSLALAKTLSLWVISNVAFISSIVQTDIILRSGTADMTVLSQWRFQTREL